VTNERLVNLTVAQLEAMPRDGRVFISRIRRNGKILEVEPTLVVQKDDVVVFLRKLTRVGEPMPYTLAWTAATF
jgi:Trk K+ transport system NAD-binding subunit